MPQKIRELKRKLLQAGFSWRQGKGSHTIWSHPELTEPVTIAGNDGQDAKVYQEKLVRQAIAQLKKF